MDCLSLGNRRLRRNTGLFKMSEDRIPSPKPIEHSFWEN